MVAGSLVQKGDFIEETLGIAEREDIMKNGFLLASSGVVRCVRCKIPYSSLNQDKTWAEGI